MRTWGELANAQAETESIALAGLHDAFQILQLQYTTVQKRRIPRTKLGVDNGMGEGLNGNTVKGDRRSFPPPTRFSLFSFRFSDPAHFFLPPGFPMHTRLSFPIYPI